MSMYFTLYKAIKSLCPSTYKCSFSTFKEEQERSFGIFIKGGSSKVRELISGRYLERSSIMTFNVASSKDYNGMLEGLDFCEAVVKSLEMISNFDYTDPDTGNSLIITRINVMSDLNELGINKYGIPLYSLNFIVYYTEGGM